MKINNKLIAEACRYSLNKLLKESEEMDERKFFLKKFIDHAESGCLDSFDANFRVENGVYIIIIDRDHENDFKLGWEDLEDDNKDYIMDLTIGYEPYIEFDEDCGYYLNKVKICDMRLDVEVQDINTDEKNEYSFNLNPEEIAELKKYFDFEADEDWLEDYYYYYDDDDDL